MSKDEAMLAIDSGTVPVVGGPFCGAKWGFSGAESKTAGEPTRTAGSISAEAQAGDRRR